LNSVRAGCFALALGLSVVGGSAPDVEPSLRLAAGGAPTVALTFDACSGRTDRRILDELVADGIPATLFVTARWVKRNAEAIAVISAHPDLFEIENHGEQHLPAITDTPLLFGLRTAGSLEGVAAEVNGGADAIRAAFAVEPHWFRGAGARYSRDAMTLIGTLGYRIAGYSLNADIGASLAAAKVSHRIAAARAGDVIIAHINQPDRPSGAGVVEGVKALKARGVRFVRLEDVAEIAPGS
jgi:peptidoglycan/xylan/chitin deacetylase (PgdA/CDA1 family)